MRASWIDCLIRFEQSKVKCFRVGPQGTWRSGGGEGLAAIGRFAKVCGGICRHWPFTRRHSV